MDWKWSGGREAEWKWSGSGMEEVGEVEQGERLLPIPRPRDGRVVLNK